MPWEKSFDPQTALDSAMRLFWEKGYDATSMADLVKATNVSRYGLYDVFGDKQKLFIASLTHYRERFVEENFGELLLAGASVAEIREYFAKMMEFGKSANSHFGCLMCHTAVGIAAHDEVIGQYIRDYFSWTTEVFRKAIKNAQNRGELSSNSSPLQLARFLTGLVQGAAVYGRAGVDVKVISAYIATGLSILNPETQE